jgi:hypothetical protein
MRTYLRCEMETLLQVPNLKCESTSSFLLLRSLLKNVMPSHFLFLSPSFTFPFLTAPNFPNLYPSLLTSYPFQLSLSYLTQFISPPSPVNAKSHLSPPSMHSQVLTEYPHVLAPKMQMVLAAMHLAEEEVHWYFSHIDEFLSLQHHSSTIRTSFQHHSPTLYTTL